MTDQTEGLAAAEATVAASPHGSSSQARARLQRTAAEPVCFALVAAVYLVHMFATGYDRFYYDSAQYWEYGKSFVREGHFSLVAYPYTWRGYSMPLLCHVLQVIGSSLGLGDVTVVKIFGALLAATLGVVVVPRLARRLFPGASFTWTRVLALNALLFLFWRDHFDFPLTDFPTLLLAVLGILALFRASAADFIVAGLCLGLAVNMRPNYLLGLLVAAAVAALLWGQRRTLLWALPASALVVAGALVASAPQILINIHQRGSASPFLARAHDEALNSLYLGMRAQKYETYVGPPEKYPVPGVTYLDPATIKLMEREHISPITAPDGYVMFPSTTAYLRLVVHHPVEMAASAVRRIFNGLDVRYPTPYIRDLGETSTALSLLEYTLLFLAFSRLLIPQARRALGQVRWEALAVLVSMCATMVVIQAEPRYWLPLQLLVYMLVCFGPDIRTSIIGTRIARRISVVAAYVVFVLVCLTLSSATQAQIQYPVEGASGAVADAAANGSRGSIR